jgi:chemosensory pili system protein ChpA (sensor histidine kinase/response regulator)
VSELRRSLERPQGPAPLPEGAEAPRSDLDTVDPAVLRSARTQLHQGVGALELVGLPSAARLLRAASRGAAHVVAAADGQRRRSNTIERASFALLDYLGRLLAGKPVAGRLFPQYARCRLWPALTVCTRPTCGKPTWQWRDLPARGWCDAANRRRGCARHDGSHRAALMRRADASAWTR